MAEYNPFLFCNLKYLRPEKIALALGDPLLEIRKENALKIGIEPVIVKGIWREYSTTKLLNKLGRV